MNLSTELNKNFKSKGAKNLSQFKKDFITENNIKKYKEKEKSLCHINCGKNFLNVIYLDNDEIVGYYSINKNSDFISALFINEKYRGYHLGNQILQNAIKDGGKYLSVSKKNQIAINLYKNNGFKKIDSAKNYITMEKNSKSMNNLNEASEIINLIEASQEEIRNLSYDKLQLFSEALDFFIKTRNSNVDYIKAVRMRKFIDENHLLQEKSFNLEPSIKFNLDQDGNLLITKRDGVDFNTIFNNSHQLLKEYEKVDNIEGMKYELCKLYMMVSIINQKYIHNKSIFASKDKIKKMISLKSFIMSDFHKYINIILKNEKNFNFNEYFSNTQFGIETYKIDNRVLKGIKQILF